MSKAFLRISDYSTNKVALLICLIYFSTIAFSETLGLFQTFFVNYIYIPFGVWWLINIILFRRSSATTISLVLVPLIIVIHFIVPPWEVQLLLSSPRLQTLVLLRSNNFKGRAGLVDVKEMFVDDIGCAWIKTSSFFLSDIGIRYLPGDETSDKMVCNHYRDPNSRIFENWYRASWDG